MNPPIYVNGELVGHGMSGMADALAAMLDASQRPRRLITGPIPAEAGAAPDLPSTPPESGRVPLLATAGATPKPNQASDTRASGPD